LPSKSQKKEVNQILKTCDRLASLILSHFPGYEAEDRVAYLVNPLPEVIPKELIEIKKKIEKLRKHTIGGIFKPRRESVLAYRLFDCLKKYLHSKTNGTIITARVNDILELAGYKPVPPGTIRSRKSRSKANQNKS
jgi:hypothetical protein